MNRPVTGESTSFEEAEEPKRRPEKTSEFVARQIVSDIVRNGMRPGDVLPPENDMLSRYRVGRSSVREALRLLEVSGLIYLKPGPGGGPILADTSSNDLGKTMTLYFQVMGVTFRDLVAARVTIEPLIARVAAENSSPEFHEELRETVEAAKKALHDGGQYAIHVQHFHSMIAAGASVNPILGLIVRSLAHIYGAFLRVRHPQAGRQGERGEVIEVHQSGVIQEHEEIAKAIIKGDAAAAERLMAAHMAQFADYVSTEYAASLDEVVEWY